MCAIRYREESMVTDTRSDVFGLRMPNKKLRDGQPQKDEPILRRETRRGRGGGGGGGQAKCGWMAKRVSGAKQARYLVLDSCWLSCESTDEELQISSREKVMDKREKTQRLAQTTATHKGQGDSRGEEKRRTANIDPPSTKIFVSRCCT